MALAFAKKFKMLVVHATRQIPEHNTTYNFTFQIELTYIPTDKSFEYTYTKDGVGKHSIVTKQEFLSYIIKECFGFVNNDDWVPVEDEDGLWYYNKSYGIENMSGEVYRKKKLLSDDVKDIMNDDYETFLNSICPPNFIYTDTLPLYGDGTCPTIVPTTA
jgi:hypothetical protein